MQENEFVAVREVGLRDGLQLISSQLPTATKIQWIEAQAAAGFREIEVTSFVPPKLLPQFKDAEEVLAAAQAIDGLSSHCLVLNVKGATRAFDAGAKNISFVVSASEEHSQSNVRCSSEQALDQLRAVFDLRDEQRHDCQIGLAIATAFGCSLQGNVALADVIKIAKAGADLGAVEITLADTVGYGDPLMVEQRFRAVKKEIGDIPLAAHFHDTRGMGLANVHAALNVGVRRFDASLGGLGGCPFAPGASGNIATEDLVYMAESMGMNTGVDVDKMLELREDLAKWLPKEQLGGTLLQAGLAKTFG